MKKQESLTLTSLNPFSQLESQTNNEHPAYKLMRIARSKGKTNADPEILSPLEQFGLSIGVLRRNLRMTREDLARKTNIPEDQILEIETGLRDLFEIINIIPTLAKGLNANTRALTCLLNDLLNNGRFT